ncbi:cyclase family protein [Candidatus Woesearchaeota archaeon]|nr:cyclase family protein [Candidatus Woesearchaeota archaeon]
MTLIIDLTLPIDEKTPVFPGDPAVEIKQLATIAQQGWNEKRITFNSHFSTHIDAPFHMLQQGKKLTDFPPETWIGEAIVIDARGQQEIEPELKGVKKGDFVFFCTGHVKKAYTKDYFKLNPVITRKTAEALVQKKVRMVGLDSFTPDNPPYEMHKLLFKHDILIIENLVGLEKLCGKRFTCFVFPLKIKDADGAPCRVMGVFEQ